MSSQKKKKNSGRELSKQRKWSIQDRANINIITQCVRMRWAYASASSTIYLYSNENQYFECWFSKYFKIES